MRRQILWAPAVVLVLAACASAGGRTAADSDLLLQASLSDKRLTVRKGSATLATYPIAVGKAAHPTPTGTFQIRRLVWNPRWVPPDSRWAKGKTAKPPGHPANPMQGVKIFFREPTYYIHGTNDEASIGRAASHGCIRMTAEDAASVAKLVMEHGGEPRPAGWYQRIRRAITKEQVVQLPQSIVLRIDS